MKNSGLNIKIEDVRPEDMQAVLDLNQGALPEVSSLTFDELLTLKDQCCYFRVARVNGEVAGFLMALQKGQDYKSLNYQWFVAQYEDFVYIDRVIVAEKFRGQGIGKALYKDIEVFTLDAHAEHLTCEVNIEPPNPGSTAFHKAAGFDEVGQQETEGGKKRVSLLAKHPVPEAPHV